MRRRRQVHIVGALGLLLGERASADLIRSGAEKATVEGVFDVAKVRGIVELADERGIDVEDDTLVLKREIAANGRGRAWINGAPVTATVLAEIGRQLVNLHGQHDAQTLLDGESQRRILDAFGGADSQSDLVAGYGELSECGARLRRSRRAALKPKSADYLRHVAKEIEDARLRPRGLEARGRGACWGTPTSCEPLPALNEVLSAKKRVCSPSSVSRSAR